MPEFVAIPGVAELWELTLGDPEVGVAMIDGAVDLSHPCFAGADIVVVEPGRRPATVGPAAVATDVRAEHATWVASVLFGQHGSPVAGLAPRCTGIVVPALPGGSVDGDPLTTARAIGTAVAAGARIILIELCLLTRSGDVDDVLKGAVAGADEAGALVVAGTGNEYAECSCFPAASPEVLAVGAYDDEGRVYRFSNWGGEYEGHGLAAPGGNILGAIPGGGAVTHNGTSCSGPVAAGVAALLVSLQRRQGRPADPHAVRDALLRTARPCTSAETDGEPARCLAGKLDVPAATRLVLAGAERGTAPRRSAAPVTAGVAPQAVPAAPGAVAVAAGVVGSAAAAPVDVGSVAGSAVAAVPAASAAPGEVVLSGGGWSPFVYALGALGYDFGSEARRDSFKQVMAPVAVGGSVVPANPYDGRQMADHLAAHASEGKALIWTLNLELTPIYAVEPVGPFAAGVYELLGQLLAGEVAGEDDAEFVERVSVPGRLTDRTVKLFSGQVVPVVEVEQVRGLYGWRVNSLIEAAVAAAGQVGGEGELGGSLREFLTRVYYDLRNLGATSRDRALNFAATNAFQAAHTFAAAVAAGMALDTIGVEKSPFCRMDSDCWDVKLRFFDPENSRRARKVFRFTIDVSDTLPVTLGDVRTWSEAAGGLAS
jgi:cyanobactin maturation PatA/PatG family protease